MDNTLPTINQQAFILNLWHGHLSKIINGPNNPEIVLLKNLIKDETDKFNIFQLLVSRANFQVENWVDFRMKDFVEILYTALEFKNYHLIDEVWPKIKVLLFAI